MLILSLGTDYDLLNLGILLMGYTNDISNLNYS